MLKTSKKAKRMAENRSIPKVSHWTLSSETKRGIFIVILFTLSFLSLLSFFNVTGTVGYWITHTLGLIFGWMDWLIPILLLMLTFFLLQPGKYDIKIINYVGLAFIIVGLSGLLHLAVRTNSYTEILDKGQGGGWIGYMIGNNLYQLASVGGAFVLLLAVFMIGCFIFFNASFTSLVNFWHQIRYAVAEQWSRPRTTDNELSETPGKNPFRSAPITENEDDIDDLDEEPVINQPGSEMARAKKASALAAKPPKKAMPAIDLPVDLLTVSTDVPASGDIKANLRKIEMTLKNFGIEVTMGEVNVGPTVTQYTLKPAEGVKLNQITTLHNDLSLALAAHPIRIEAPIPGKSLVGIEVPNQAVSIVKLREILESPAYQNRKSSLMLALGKDVSGRSMMADLAKMPHLLIAGATGSGKSVCINSMIVSLLYQNSPDQLKFILVDPKRVELSNYDGMPHLITPVITEVDKTINALRWAVAQMDERYKMLQAAGKKNIQAYNEARLLDKMPYIVIVIDELADLMMVAAKEVEAAIIRLAQMARAVGIHLILATQRPSVNVITGLIKANITSRIAFAVASVIDSRTIIDSSGAEKLLGNGDMLFVSAELSQPRRLQGAYISDKEIVSVTDYLKERGEPEYESEVIERRSGPAGAVTNGYDGGDDEQDIRQATEVVVKAHRASATLLQSRMRVGFAKASRLLDVLEERGIIGPQNSSKPREVLISEEEWRQTKGDTSGGVYETETETEEIIDEEEFLASNREPDPVFEEDEDMTVREER